MNAMDEAELRRLVREVLLEVLRDGGGDALRDAVRQAVRAAVPESPTPDSRYRVDASAVTERRIVEAAGAGATSVLIGRRAVLTPLARDKARALGLTVHREA